jgi:uncharacterized protein (TIGR00303 family)
VLFIDLSLIEIDMAFLSDIPSFSFKRPLFAGILGNTMLSTVRGISGAGPSPAKTVLTPGLDAELITYGEIRSMAGTSDTPSGCPTPASITRAMMKLSGLTPLFINAGLTTKPPVPCLDVYGEPGRDPRVEDAIPDADRLRVAGARVGEFLSSVSDLLVLGECVPGGTTTALCVLRGLGYEAAVSSSFAQNPVSQKEAIWREVQERLKAGSITEPFEVVRATGDPMLAVAIGIAETYTGTLILAGGTQMLAVAAVLKGIGRPVPFLATTEYVRRDPSANIEALALEIGAKVFYVDPGFATLGHPGLARYCIGEVKEGMGAGGAMLLAALLGHTPEAIRQQILSTVMMYR